MAKEKGGLALLLGAPKSEPKKSGGGSEETEAAQDIIDAVKAGDAEMLSTALKLHYELCAGDGGDEDEDEETY